MGKLRKFKRKSRIFLQRKVDRRFYVFVVCLFVSAFIWMMMQLSGSSVTSLTYPIEYTNIPEDYVLTDTSVNQVNLQIRSVGFGILAEKYFTKAKPVHVDLEKAYKSGVYGKRFVLTKELRGQIENQLGSNRDIVVVSPDTLWVNVSKRVKKKVKVDVKLDIQPADRFFISSGPQAIPDSVMVEGPSSILDSLDSVSTANAVLQNVKKGDTVFVDIIPENPLVSALESEVKIAFNIDELTERKVSVPIQVYDPPKGVVIRTFPDSIDVSFSVGLKTYDKITSTDFVARLEDLKEVDLSEAKKLQVELSRIPEGISNISYEPERVAFVLEEK